MNSSEFAAKVRAKYPGSYDSLDDDTLTKKVLEKYPEYQSVVDTGPGTLKSAALGVMSGIPGAETVVSGIQAISPDKTYEQAHQELETAKDQAWEKHPVAYGAGKTTGMVGTGLVAPASIPGAIGVGALSGVDAAKSLSDAPLEAAKGAAIGGGLGLVGEKVISPALDSLMSTGTSLAKRGMAALGKETGLQDIETYLQKPGVINAATDRAGISNKVADLTNDITTASGHLSEMARGELSPSTNAVDIKGLKDAAMEAVKKYYVEGNPATAADESSIKAIIDQYQKLAGIAESNNGQVPETVLRQMIDRLQAATKESTYGNPEASASQQALKEFSGKLNDILRGGNEKYTAAMAPSAEAASLSSDLQKGFSLEGMAPTDATTNKVGNLLKEGKPDEAALATRLKNMTGVDLMDAMKNTQTKENFNAPGSGEAMKALFATLGFGAGKMTGVPYGGIAGAAVGRFAASSINGGKVAKNLMDLYMSGSKSFGDSAIKPLLEKFGPVLINAAKQGGNQLAATHFVLATSNPEYQKLVNHMQDQTDETANTGIVNEE